jgi:hypothetical protein
MVVPNGWRLLNSVFHINSVKAACLYRFFYTFFTLLFTRYTRLTLHPPKPIGGVFHSRIGNLIPGE